MTTLRGITWAHSRGVDPVQAAARAWRDQPGAPQIAWQARSLADFEDASILELAQQYDVIAIDHPHLGQAAAEGALAPVPDEFDPALDGSGDSFAGLSLESYRHDGRLLALPADAATMVTATVDPGSAPTTWDDVVACARTRARDTVVLPANPTHLLLTVLSVADAVRSSGARQADGRPAWWTETIEVDRLAVAIALVGELLRHVPEWCLTADPIRILDALAEPDGPTHVPLVFGYSPYSRAQSGRRLVHFQDAPAGPDGPSGTVLGGVGFAASALRGDPSSALDVVRRLATRELQCGLMVEAGGQPAHSAAVSDARIDAEFSGFYSRTAETVRRSFLRPRTVGYPDFQKTAGIALHAAMTRGASPDAAARIVRDEWESRGG